MHNVLLSITRSTPLNHDINQLSCVRGKNLPQAKKERRRRFFSCVRENGKMHQWIEFKVVYRKGIVFSFRPPGTLPPFWRIININISPLFPRTATTVG